MLLEFNDHVLDIREQYPLLPLEQTLLISSESRIPHPKNKKNEDEVMTTDFVIDLKDGRTVVRTVKFVKDLDDLNVMEHFEIERQFFEIQGWDWGIVTENTMNRVKADNIAQCRKYYYLERYDTFCNMDKDQIDEYKEAMYRMLFNTDDSLYQIANEFDMLYKMPNGTGISIFEHLVIRKKISINLSNPLDYKKPIKINSLDELFEDDND